VKSSFRGMARDAAKKFPDDPGVAPPVFVKVDRMGRRKLIDAEMGNIPLHIQLGQDIVLEISVKRIARLQVAQVSHDV